MNTEITRNNRLKSWLLALTAAIPCITLAIIDTGMFGSGGIDLFLFGNLAIAAQIARLILVVSSCLSAFLLFQLSFDSSRSPHISTVFLLAVSPAMLFISLLDLEQALSATFLTGLLMSGNRLDKSKNSNSFILLVVFLLLLFWIEPIMGLILLPATAWLILSRPEALKDRLRNLLILLISSTVFLVIINFGCSRVPSQINGFDHAMQPDIQPLASFLVLSGLCLLPIGWSCIRRWGGMWPYGLIGGVIAICAAWQPLTSSRVIPDLQLYSVSTSATFFVFLVFIFGSIGGWVILSSWSFTGQSGWIMGVLISLGIGSILFGSTIDFLGNSLWIPLLILLGTNDWVKPVQRWSSLFMTMLISLALILFHYWFYWFN